MKLQPEIDVLRAQIADLEKRVRLHDAFESFVHGEHEIREGDYFVLYGDLPSRLMSVSSVGKWTYWNGRDQVESSPPHPSDRERLYTAAEVAAIVARSREGYDTKETP